jgi:predicted N-acetyltransferase YhbS
MAHIRVAEERDAEGIQTVLQSVYGADYAYPQYYNLTFLKKIIFSENALVLVAEADGKVVGTASVVLESGAYTDLVGEFGRLAVHPEYQGRGIGNGLMAARLERVRQRLHVGFVVARTVHARAQAISIKHGFAPVGFLPLNLQFGPVRESTAYMVTYFGPGLELRRNNPRVVPEVAPLAGLAMDGVGLSPDFIVDETEPPLGYPEELTFEEMTAEGYAPLLRLERGRLLQRDVFGPMRLQYGFFRLQARNSRYIIARNGSEIVGALGFIHDANERAARVFEMIHIEDGVVRGLLGELEDQCRAHLDVAYIEIDVNAHTPGVQRTLIELGYVPTAYVPALAFHRVERIDVVKMALLLDPPPEPGAASLIPAMERIAARVEREFQLRRLVPRIGEAMAGSAPLMDGLSPEQVHRLGGICEPASFDAGGTIFCTGEPGSEAYLLLEGRVAVERDGQVVGHVGPGEALGEVALLTDSVHSATARAVESIQAARLSREALTELVRRRPDVGVVLYRNLAQGLGRKLRRAGRDELS